MGRFIRLGVLAVFLSFSARQASAEFHFMDINEVYSNADGSVQFVEFIALAGGQTQLQFARVVARGADGTPVTLVLDLTSEFLPLGNGETFLIATAGFQAVAGFAPDFVIPNNSLIPFPDGRVTFEADPNLGSLIYDGVAYGTYTGSNSPYGTPTAELPCNNRQSLTRISSNNFNSLGFGIRTWSPRRNDGTTTTNIPGFGTDCNDNQSPDLCDIARGDSPDENGNDIPDECEPPPACQTDPDSCDDSNVCNGLEICNPGSGICSPGEFRDCNDDSVCTVDTCDPQDGCIFTPINCEDDAVCSVNDCHPISGCKSEPLDCDNGDPCDFEECLSEVGCVSTPNCGPGFDCDNGECLCYQPPGDFNGDGVLDSVDALHELDCLGGPEGEPLIECLCADMDGDGDIDLKDLADFLPRLTSD